MRSLRARYVTNLYYCLERGSVKDECREGRLLSGASVCGVKASIECTPSVENAGPENA